MNNEQSTSLIQEKVQARIQSGDLKPRSRLVLTTQVVGTIISAVVALAAVLLTLSFIFYGVYESGEVFLLGFGWEGVWVFFLLFPWLSLATTIVLLAIFQWRLSYLLPTYRVPLLSLFAFLVVAVACVGYLAAPLHNAVFDQIENANLPVIGELYEEVYESREHYGIYRGIATSVEEDGVWMARSDGDADEDDAERFVLLPEGSEAILAGDELFIFGEQRQGIIYASNVIALPATTR